MVAGPTLLYYVTRARHETRRFLPCLLWTVAQLYGTVGCSIVLAGLVVTYQLLLADGQAHRVWACNPSPEKARVAFLYDPKEGLWNTGSLVVGFNVL